MLPSFAIPFFICGLLFALIIVYLGIFHGGKEVNIGAVYDPYNDLQKGGRRKRKGRRSK